MSENNLMADKLLKAIQEEERDKARGRLKIFFGYAAGVGKTYAMLKAAHEAKQRGIDVIAGYIEPHARPKTAALFAWSGSAFRVKVFHTTGLPSGNLILMQPFKESRS